MRAPLVVASALALAGGARAQLKAEPFAPIECPSGWDVVESRCWFSSGNDNRRWKDAEAECKLGGGHLLSIHSEAENQAAYNLCKDNNFGNGCCEKGVCWLGLFQVQGQDEKDFQWTDGSIYTLNDEIVYDSWAPNEPNNVGTSGEDCVHNWDRRNSQGDWNDEPCNNEYPFLCGQPALCEAGAYLSQEYAPWDNGKLAQCNWCPAGTFRQTKGGVGVDSCLPCPAGTMGGKGEKAVCSTPCPAGHWCPEGTSKDAAVNSNKGRKTCPPGRYGPRQGLTSADECLECAPGYYCPGNGETSATAFQCKASFCGFAGQSQDTCNQKCPAGFRCPAGSACPEALVNGQTPSNSAPECGGVAFYCPTGTITPRAVDDGHYTAGGDETTRSSQVLCEPGYFCSGGLRNTCPGGSFTDVTGSDSELDCSPCAAGYVCPAGSANTSPRSLNCYDEDFISSLGNFNDVIGKPAAVYCPAGSALPVKVSNNFYSTPETAATLNNRVAQTVCDLASVCREGLRNPLLVWTDTFCADAQDKLSVDEMASPGVLRTVTAGLNQNVNTADYVVSYRLDSVSYVDPTKFDCEPDSEEKNQNKFSFVKNNNNGEFRLAQPDLNFEVCLPELDIRYNAKLQAQARRTSDNTLVSTIDCNVEVTVNDLNDKPSFVNFDDAAQRVYHRQIREKVDRNVPVAVCDTEGSSFGCPTSTDATVREPEVSAEDEDDGSNLRYSIVSSTDVTDIGKQLFKIDPCSGLLSAREGGAIAYKSTKTITYRVRVEDDGNGGLYPTKSDEVDVIIHVIDRNDPPVIDEDNGLLTIPENAPENTETNFMIGATDEDESDTLTFQLESNDGDAFKIVNNRLMTTRVGAQSINFESSKKEYFLKIQVQDGRGGIDSASYVVRVVDTNDAPTFVGAITFFVPENSPDTQVCLNAEGTCRPGAVETFDEDNNGNGDTIAYSIKHLDEDGISTPVFQIDESTGAIRTVASAAGSIDFEDESISLADGTGRGYKLEVTATSRPGEADERSTTQQVVVYVVDVNEAPQITTDTEFSVLEIWPVGEVLPGFIEADDPDNRDTVLLGAVAPQQSLLFSGSNEFFIVQTTEDGRGQIKVNKKLDFESLGTNPISLTVRVEDNGGPVRGSSTKTLQIRVVDANEAPVFANSRVTVIADENQVFVSDEIVATDNDSGDTLSYSIVGGNGKDKFTLVPSGTGFKVNQLESFQLNFELASKEWVLNIQAEDSGPSAKIAAACSVVNSQCGAGAVCNENRCYERCFDTDETPANEIGHDELFRCAYPDGQSPNGNILGVPTAPFTEKAELTFVLQVRDVNDPPALKTCPSEFIVAANIDSQAQDISASTYLTSETVDEDAQNAGTTFLFAPYTYSLEMDNDPNSLFSVVEDGSGRPVVHYEPQNGVSLTAGSTFTGVIKVTDTAAAFSTCAVTIRVVEQNNPPVLADVRTSPIDENSANLPNANDIVVLDKLEPVDPDDDEVFTFTITPNPFFEMDSATGRITLGNSAIDYESLPADTHEYTLVVLVRDKNGAEDVAEIFIPVNDLNEAPFFQSSDAFQIDENQPAGTPVPGADLKALSGDPDVLADDASHRTLTFELVECVGQPSDCPFSVNANTGAITITRALNFEAEVNSWDLLCRVTDGPGLFAERTFRVVVNDVNEPPKFTEDDNQVNVDEGDLDQNAALFSMLQVVSDEDEVDTVDSLQFQITSGNDAGNFIIEGGFLKGNGFVVDYETEQEYVLGIRVTDSVGNSDNSIVRIKVQNLNDVRIEAVQVSSGSTLACGGGSQVLITGRNLGMTGTEFNADTQYVVTYTSTITGVAYQCANVRREAAGDNTRLRCDTAAGVGAGFTWRVSVTVDGLQVQGDTSAPFSTPAMAYGLPVISAVAGADDVPTRGGSSIQITGSCIGSTSDFPNGFAGYASNLVRYCTGTTPCFDAASCVLSAANELSCETVAGVGANFRWEVRVLGRRSALIAAGEYAAPVVSTASITTLPSDGVLSAPGIVFTGDNFGTADSVPQRAFADFVSAHNAQVTREYEFLGCTVTKAFEEITCTGVEPGMGKDMPVVIGFGNQLSNANTTAVVVEYARPVITSFTGEGVRSASTAGGQQVIVHGTGFGPACGKAATETGDNNDGIVCDLLKTTYSRGSTRASDGSLIVYSSKCAVVSGRQIACVTAPGTGAGHTWTFDLGGHVIVFSGTKTSYEVPTVGAYEGAGSSDASTTGGEEVIIKGSNFGPLNGAEVVAYYGPEGNPKEFTARDCVVTLENERVRCTTVPGAGDQLKWTLFVDGQESRAEVTDYGPPVLEGFVPFDGGVELSALSNFGDERIQLTGFNFGPAFPSYLEAVTYGPDSNPNAYEPDCEVDSHDSISCTTVPGIGDDLRWRVTVKGQSSLLSTQPISYILPEIVDVSQLSGPTDGGYLVRIEAKGLAVCDDQSLVQVLFGERKVGFSNIYDLVESETVPVDLEAACPLNKDSAKVLDFAVPEMIGDALIPLGLRASSKLFEDVFDSDLVNFRFDDPLLESVYAEPVGDSGSNGACVGDYRVSLRGRNFCASKNCCKVMLNGKAENYILEFHSHRLISVCTSEVGLVFVQCADVKSNVLSFNAESPFIFQTTTSRDLPLKSVNYPTRATGDEEIEIWGLYFGLGTPNVTVGGIEAAVIDHIELECDDDRIPPHNFGSLLALDTICYRTTIIVPDGQGKANPIIVAVGNSDQTSLANNEYEFVNYLPPVIDSVSLAVDSSAVERANGTTAPTEGGATLYITGSNFGLSGSVTLVQLTENNIVLNTAGVVNCTEYDHEQLVCTMPPGEGANLAVRLAVSNQDTSAQDGDFLVSYSAPVISNIDLAEGASDTSGGGLVTLTGSNFGRPFARTCPSLVEVDCTPIRPKVILGNLVCVLQSNSHTSLQCAIPPGEGRDLELSLEVRGQIAETGELFSYAPPEIDYFTPDQASTDGVDADGEIEYLEIYGRNFGVDLLTVSFEIEGSEERIVAQRSAEEDIDDFHADTNHTMIRLRVPPYRGTNITIIVDVAGQVVNSADKFAYKPPSVTGIVTVDKDGVEHIWDSGSTTPIDDHYFSDDSEEGEARRRRLQTGPDVLEMSLPEGGPCQRSISHRGLSWRTVQHDIYKSDYFERSVLIFSGEFCEAESVLALVSMTGEYQDVLAEGERVAVNCLTTFRQIVNDIKVTPKSAAGLNYLSQPTCCGGQPWELEVERDVGACIIQSGCPTLSALTEAVQSGERFGVYLSTKRSELYMSQTASSLAALADSAAFRLPDKPSAVLVETTALNAPTGPTSGCFVFEPYRDYLQRRREEFERTGSALNVFRRCLSKSRMIMNGDNFSVNLLNASREIRVFFHKDGTDLNETAVQFEAATTSSQGDHPEACSEEEGCEHNHERIAFQIPPGFGRNLRISIQVGNQIAEAVNVTTGKPLLFHYNAPEIDYASPGSLFFDRAFSDADGGQSIELIGDNFGGVASPASVLVGGRVCDDAEWRSGDEDEEGQPFLSCTTRRDVTGPKSLFVCVAGQVAYAPAARNDGVLLVDADRLDDQGADEAAIKDRYRDTASLINSRCKSTYDQFGAAVGRMGGLSELCVACPEGSICNEPDAPFSPPSSQAGFFRLDVATRDEAGALTERAVQRCAPERWDLTYLEEYPSLVFSETCPDYVSCEPAEACVGDNQCSEGYTYNFERCEEVRGADGFDNSCAVVFDFFTSTYRGVDTDCNPNPGTACDPDKPEECSTCQVIVDEDGTARGQCTCQMPQRCALCSAFTHFRLNNRCKECPDNPLLVIIGFVVLIVGAVIGGYILNKRNFNLAIMAIIIDFFQVLAVFSSVNIVWPESLIRLFQLLALFNLNIDIAAPECLVPNLEYETKWFLMEAMPLAVLAMLLLSHLLYSLYKIVVYRRRAKLFSHVSRLISVFLIIMYVMYLNVTRKSLDIFNCNPLPEQDDGYTYTSFTSLSCDGGSLCRCGEGIQDRLVPLAAIFLVLYSAGFPAAVFTALKRNHELIREDQYLRASGVGDIRASNPRAYDIRKRYSGVYMHFKPECTYWIMNILARKFAVAAGALMFRSNTTFQLSVILLVLFVSFCLHLQYRPYLSTGERSIVLRQLDEKAERGRDLVEFQSFTELQRRVQECVKKHKEVMHKKGARFDGKDMWKDSANMGRMAKAVARRRRAQELFFDYNTVEAVLLASSILICLGGVMFSSGRFDDRPDIVAQRDLISYLIIITVVLTILYLILVVLVEIFPTLTVRSFTKCLQVFQQRKPEDHEVVDLNADLQMEANPMFEEGYKPANNRLKEQLGEAQAELDRMAKQNEDLRRELQRSKQTEQQGADNFETFGVPNPMMQTTRKEFGQTRAADKPKRTLFGLGGSNRKTGSEPKSTDEVEDEL